MDEILMCFKLSLIRSLEFSGNRIVLVKLCGVEKRIFTVIFGVVVDGIKLFLVVKFKGVRIFRDLVVFSFVRVLFYKKGWMDE